MHSLITCYSLNAHLLTTYALAYSYDSLSTYCSHPPTCLYPPKVRSGFAERRFEERFLEERFLEPK